MPKADALKNRTHTLNDAPHTHAAAAQPTPSTVSLRSASHPTFPKSRMHATSADAIQLRISRLGVPKRVSGRTVLRREGYRRRTDPGSCIAVWETVPPAGRALSAAAAPRRVGSRLRGPRVAHQCNLPPAPTLRPAGTARVPSGMCAQPVPHLIL